MASSQALKAQIRGLKRKLNTPLGVLSFFAALITVCSFTIGVIEWIQRNLHGCQALKWFTQGSGTEALFLLVYAMTAVYIWRRCVFILARPRLCYRFDGSLWLGAGLQIALAMPAGLWQMLTNTHYLAMEGKPLWTRILIPITHWPFNVGGASIRWVYHGSLAGWGRLWSVDPSEIMPQMAYLMVLTGFQGLLLAWLFAVRFRHIRRFRDWGIGLGCALFLVNSIAVIWFS